MKQIPADRRRTGWVRVTTWFLGLSYGVGAPLTAFLEYRDHLLSVRFDLPPTFLYLVFVVQFCAAVLLLAHRLLPWAVAALTATTIGAIVSHFRIGSPQTSVTALLYTVLQIWYGFATRDRGRTAVAPPGVG